MESSLVNEKSANFMCQTRLQNIFLIPLQSTITVEDLVFVGTEYQAFMSVTLDSYSIQIPVYAKQEVLLAALLIVLIRIRQIRSLFMQAIRLFMRCV